MSKIFLFFSIILLSQFALFSCEKDLFDATQYKYMKMKNRVIKTAIEDFESWENGKVTDKYIQRYEKLSKSEIGTMITGCIMIEPVNNFPVPVIDKDEYISEFKKLTDVVHKNGANIIAQI